MHICFDLDNTLLMDRAITQASQELGYSYTQAYHTSWDLEYLPDEIRQRAKELWVDPGYMTSLEDYPGARQLLKHITKDLGHTVSIVTARVETLREPTEGMVAQRYGEGITVYVVGMGTDKTTLLKRIQCDLWIDDSPTQVQKTLDAGIRTVLVSNDNTKYNWYMRADRRAIHRASVAEIEDSIFEDTPCIP